MGGIVSRSRPVQRVALVGMTETGKSHFLSVLCEDGLPPTGPTNGLDRIQKKFGRETVQFVEFGWSALARGVDRDLQTGQPFDTIVWFIDEHDTACDVLAARSAMLGFATSQIEPLSLCVILNRGRPHGNRRKIAAGVWTEPIVQSPHDQRVSWQRLGEFIDTEGLRRHFGRGIYATELSYRDAYAAKFCLDWILDPSPTSMSL